MLRGHEFGVKATDMFRNYRVSDATFYNYRSKCGGLTVSDAARLRTLEEGSLQLKDLLEKNRPGFQITTLGLRS